MDNNSSEQTPLPETEQTTFPIQKPALENGKPSQIIIEPPITSQEQLRPLNGGSSQTDYNIKKPWDSFKTSNPSKGSELFIGNLHIDTTEDDLYSSFKEHGTITDLRLHKNKQTKKCYAFIRFQTRIQATNAMSLNGTYLNGRMMKVSKSNENSTIFIGNIRKTWTQHEVEVKIKRIFNNAERIEYFKDPMNHNKNRGFCFAVFRNRNEAIKALNYVSNKGGIMVDGISLTCDWADVVDEDDSQSKQVFISGVNEQVNEDQLMNYFMKYGNVQSVVMSKKHISSKRKDLVFVSYENHIQAYHAVIGLNEDKENNNESVCELFKVKNKEELSNIQISLAFSQQAMQNKKKMKDGRKKINQISAKINGNEMVIANSNNSDIPSSLGNTCSNNIHLLQSQLINPLFENNVNATAMLAMVNLLNMNKNNPVILNQMISAGLGAMANSAMNVNQQSTLPQLTKQTRYQFLGKKHKLQPPHEHPNSNSENH